MEWNEEAKIGWQANPVFYNSHRLSGAPNSKDVACINTPVTNSSTVVFKISGNGTCTCVSVAIGRGWTVLCVDPKNIINLNTMRIN